MERDLSLFGPALVNARMAMGKTQWIIAVTTQCHVTNLSKIEKGSHLPGVMLALQLVGATGYNLRSFFQELNTDQTERVLFSGKTPKNAFDEKVIQQRLLQNPKCLFGPFFVETRLRFALSQKDVAEAVGCTLRSMTNMEKGSQEPNIMLALQMVAVTGEDTGAFFERLYAYTQSVK